MDPSLLHLTIGMPELNSCEKELFVWRFYKVTIKVASIGLAVLSFGEQILGKENEMWPPPDELPEFRKPHWSIVWSMLGWSDTDLCWSWRGERWAECHPCLGRGVWMGECWLSREHFMAACWRSKSLCSPPLPLQPCVLPSSIATMVFLWWGAGKERGEKDAEQVGLKWGEEVCIISLMMLGIAGEKKAWELFYWTKLCSKKEDPFNLIRVAPSFFDF